jgi:hypothetical protein
MVACLILPILFLGCLFDWYFKLLLHWSAPTPVTLAGACCWYWFTLLTLVINICLGYYTGCKGYTSLALLLLLLLGYNIVVRLPFCLAYGFCFLCCLWVLDSGFWVSGMDWCGLTLWTVLLGLGWDSLLLLGCAALFVCIILWIYLWLYQLLVQPWALCCPSVCLVVFCYLLPLSNSFHAGRWTVVIIPCLMTCLSLLGI